MKEDLQIKIAAEFVDTDAPEKLSDKRAGEFISKTIGRGAQSKEKSRNIAKSFVWGGSVLTVAAGIALAVVVFRPGGSDGYGTPSQLIEMQSVHSSAADADTSLTEVSDTVLVYEIVEE